MGDSQRFALENSPQIAKIIVIHQNFRRYCRKAILYPTCVQQQARASGNIYEHKILMQYFLNTNIVFDALVGSGVSGCTETFRSVE